MPKQPLLKMQGISKQFGPTLALQDVDLQVVPGQVLALIGENGAGKSTLLKVLSGAHRADRGTMELLGRSFQPHNPHDSRQSGVAMIYQELNLAPDLSVEDNLLLGQAGTGGGLLLRSKQRQRVANALKMVGLQELSPTAKVGQQSVATQQLIEIARALISEAKLILFDEPTSSLSQDDVSRLFNIIERLKTRGLGIVYISHFLEEVRDVADCYTVLRDGRMVGAGELSSVDDKQIISLMVGRDVDDLFPHVPHQPGETVVSVCDLSGDDLPRDVTVDLREGEIFGLAGLIGAGRTEFIRCLFGLDPIVSGEVTLRSRRLPKHTRGRLKAGLGMLSEDRKHEGLAQDLSLIDNISVSRLEPYSKFGWLQLGKRDQRVNQLIREMEIKARDGQQAVCELSGGNQQKVAIARILHQESQILLMDEPTKGIDVGTKAEIYRMMGRLAAEGRTIIFVSSYLPELLAVCDRIGVMARGKLREIRETSQWTDDAILESAMAAD